MKLFALFENENTGKPREIQLQIEGNRLRATWDGRQHEADWVEVGPGVFSLLIEGRSYEAHVEKEPAGYRVLLGPKEFRIVVVDPRDRKSSSPAFAPGDGKREISAPMPGRIVRVLAEEGQEIQAGAGVVVIEAMKMQNEIPAPQAGRVVKIFVSEGTSVETGQKLFEVEPV